ncbi:5-(carboxyamino)imidazole ribonucleotide mutase [Conexibacter sp. W3-3-2]|uniref:5-(Carboxyamino)imidazole ribonucleotide mutase n=1 Tax=Paraconexibacter algicola TaxID=2133960 RepID=A0A2T4UI75_9ACTN|nr:MULTISPECIES: AIR carboxylase family protein [Solirubrobacterales]MTD45243.1 5-(carboxyamino)imidazole ribonucleotide mutase [Conexibacter sp. W3-3-2]PTL58943.1 5-(carboxyamino)imidazole ribonucleotide mutase [Paraconexibacter algicola]
MSEQPGADLTPTTRPEVAFEELEVGAPRVGIVMGTKAALPVMEQAGPVLEEAGVRYEIRVLKSPEAVADYCRNARMRGLRVIVAGAALSAGLPGVAAAHTDLPVIGVPLTAPGTVSGGLDAVLGVVQMAPGVPVAAVGLDNAQNAAHLALRILAA